MAATFRKLGDDASGALKVAAKASAELVADEAKSRVPRRSGRLAGSIRATSTARGDASVKVGGARLIYAPIIHFGWPGHNISPQPFLLDALDARRGEIVEGFETALRSILSRF